MSLNLTRIRNSQKYINIVEARRAYFLQSGLSDFFAALFLDAFVADKVDFFLLFL
jgi:hypothetical protein